MTSRENPVTSAVPLSTSDQLESQPVGQLGAQRRLVEEPRGLRVAVPVPGVAGPSERSSGPWTRLATTTCVCKSGSPARDVRWRNAAPMNPRPSNSDHAVLAAAPAARLTLEIAQRLLDGRLMPDGQRVGDCSRRRCRRGCSRSSAP